MSKVARDCDKVIRVINGCITSEQLDSANNMAVNFANHYASIDITNYTDDINQTLDVMGDKIWKRENEPKPIGFLRS